MEIPIRRSKNPVQPIRQKTQFRTALQSAHHKTQTSAQSIHRKVQPSATLSRKYVKKPTSATPKTSPLNSARHPISPKTVQQRISEKKQVAALPKKPSAKELKDRAIKKALADVVKKSPPAPIHKPKLTNLSHFFLALSCTAATIFVILYTTNLNKPTLPLRVAAMQTGINATYPSYVPRDFSLSDILSENQKITLNFRHKTLEDRFSLTEEKSSWDSNTLLKNYVLPAFGKDYTILRDNELTKGLTIYIHSYNATWLNGGVLYKLTSESLTKRQIVDIATSL